MPDVIKRLRPEIIRNQEMPRFEFNTNSMKTQMLHLHCYASRVYSHLLWESLKSNDRNLMSGEIVDETIDAITPRASKLDKDIVHRVVYDIAKDQLHKDSMLMIMPRVMDPENTKSYVFAKDFYNKFKDVNLKHLRFRDIFLNECGYIRLPEPMICDQGLHYQDVFFITAGADRYPYLDNSFARMKANNNNHPSYPCNFDSMLGVTLMSECGGGVNKHQVPMPADLDLPLSIIKEQDFPMDQEISPRIEAVYKCLAYINSGKPDLREYKPKPKGKPGSSKYKIYARRNSMDDAMLVGYNWKKEYNITFKKSVWEVQGHFRWQPCGTKKQDRKLIWIDEYLKGEKRLEEPVHNSIFHHL